MLRAWANTVTRCTHSSRGVGKWHYNTDMLRAWANTVTRCTHSSRGVRRAGSVWHYDTDMLRAWASTVTRYTGLGESGELELYVFRHRHDVCMGDFSDQVHSSK